MAKPQTQTGRRALAAIFDDAARDIEEQAVAPYVDPTLPRDGVRPGEWEGFPSAALPPGCPVQVIGRDPNSDTIYCITATGHFRAIEKWDNPALLNLFSPVVHYLKWAFPKWLKKNVPDPDRPGETKPEHYVGRVERDIAIECLIQEAGRRGDFDPAQQHRGRGGWRDASEDFLWHSGGWLWQWDTRRQKLQRSRPVMHEHYLYTKQATTIEPWQQPVSVDESPARRILEELRSWQWQRPYLDPILVLGWIVTSLMGGALKARPILFTTGGAGVGKSTLMGFINSVLHGAVRSTVNTTAAGIYQNIKHDALPVLIDELENKPGTNRAEAVIELMRVAYTGGDISRGGQDHQATTFTARSSFAAFAINAPAMLPQDKSRMAMLNLDRLDTSDGIKRTPVVKIETDGRQILTQIMAGWADFRDRLMPDYYKILSASGLDARSIDTFGTLLAAAELVVGPEAMEAVGLPVAEDEGKRLGEIIAAATRVERTESLDNWHACLNHLMQSTIDSWREGVKPTVGHVCDLFRRGEAAHDAQWTRDRVQLLNLGVVDRGKARGDQNIGPCLAVPADGPQLKRVYQDTVWHSGQWHAALKGGPKDVVVRHLGDGQKVKINGVSLRCLLVDLAAFERFSAGKDE